jgi:hypothetical protein
MRKRTNHKKKKTTINYNLGEKLYDKEYDQVYENNFQDIYIIISSQLQNVCIVSALLSSWGISTYVGYPLNENKCERIPMELVPCLMFSSCGFFFISVITCLVLLTHIDSIPRKYQYQHLKSLSVLFLIPTITCALVIEFIYLFLIILFIYTCIIKNIFHFMFREYCF